MPKCSYQRIKRKQTVPQQTLRLIIHRTRLKNNNEGVSDASVENPIEEKIASVVGESKYDPDTYKQIVKEIVKEVVPLIIEEYGNFADAGFPELEDKKSSIVVPNDKLDEVFSNTTVAELTWVRLPNLLNHAPTAWTSTI